MKILTEILVGFRGEDIIRVGFCNGKLEFWVNGTFVGVAYEYIPMTEPLFPCVYLFAKNDKAKLVHFEISSV